MSNSHFPAKAWREVISDTVHGSSIYYTAQRIGCSHQAVFYMRHKVLMALQQFRKISGVRFGEVSEFDETFVPDCYKGKEMDGIIPGSPRRHGTKAEKAASPMSLCTSAQASSAKGMPWPPRATGQNPARRSCLTYLKVILRQVYQQV